MLNKNCFFNHPIKLSSLLIFIAPVAAAAAESAPAEKKEEAKKKEESEESDDDMGFGMYNKLLQFSLYERRKILLVSRFEHVTEFLCSTPPLR